VLEQREGVLTKRIEAELRKAQECVKAKNKAGALMCLKRKKMYETEVTRLANQQLRLQEQINLIEGTRTAAEVTSALASGARTLTKITRETNIDTVDKVLDDIAEQAGRIAAVQDALAAPLAADALDEDELDAELQARVLCAARETETARVACILRASLLPLARFA
jgi:charged multivesicular body protein 4